MNKSFAALFVCALAVAASANDEINDDFTQYALATTDSVETSALNKDTQVFAPFCIKSRDDVFQDIEENTNAAAAKGFTMLFSLVESLGSAGLSAIKFGNNRLTPQIANPSAGIDESSANAAEAAIVNGQHAVQNAQSQPKSFLEAFKAVVAATSSAVASAFNEKISQIKDTASTLSSTATLEQICAKAAAYEEDLQGKFETYKNEVAGESPESVNAAITLNKVPCVTSTRVIRINSICQFAKSSAPAVSRLWATRAQKN